MRNAGGVEGSQQPICAAEVFEGRNSRRGPARPSPVFPYISMEIFKYPHPLPHGMNNVKESVSVFVEKCPECGKEIKGSTERQVYFNLKFHRDAKHAEAERK